MNKETPLMREIMLALSDAGCTVFRNSTGMGWHGRVIHQAGRQVTLADAYRMPYGLAVGSADIVGIGPGGRFLSVEVKVPSKKKTGQRGGEATDDQLRWCDAINRAGGIAGIVRSVDEALDLIAKQP